MRAFPFLAPLVLPTLALMGGCGGSSASPLANPDGGAGVTDDGGGAVDATFPDTSTGDDGSVSFDASTIGDGAAAPDAGTCGSLATHKACVACCDKAFPAGLTALDDAIFACACQASVCGERDGGSAEAGVDGGADAGDFGTGACAVTCTSKATPDATCQKCVVASLGSAASPGECHAPVALACSKSAPCVKYVTCTGSCPN